MHDRLDVIRLLVAGIAVKFRRWFTCCLWTSFTFEGEILLFRWWRLVVQVLVWGTTCSGIDKERAQDHLQNGRARPKVGTGERGHQFYTYTSRMNTHLSTRRQPTSTTVISCGFLIRRYLPITRSASQTAAWRQDASGFQRSSGHQIPMTASMKKQRQKPSMKR
jgi:hypothetical protein